MATESLREPDVAPVALYGYCERAYNALLSEATTEFSSDGLSSIVVWEGMLTKFITIKMNLSVPYFSSITKALKRMGCIRQLKRGGGTAPSKWEIIKAPTIEDFLKDLPPRVVDNTRYGLLQGQVTTMNKRLLAVEKILENLFKEEAQAQVITQIQVKPPTSELDDVNGR